MKKLIQEVVEFLASCEIEQKKKVDDKAFSKIAQAS